MQPGRYKIELTNPCQESWEKMTPDSGGRFCDACQKSVIDFTGKTDTEITDYLLKNRDKSVCGRLFSHQVDRIRIEINPDILRSSIPFWQKFLAIVLVCFGSDLAGANFVFAQTETDSMKVELAQPETIRNTADLTDSLTSDCADDTAITEKLSAYHWLDSVLTWNVPAGSVDYEIVTMMSGGLGLVDAGFVDLPETGIIPVITPVSAPQTNADPVSQPTNSVRLPTGNPRPVAPEDTQQPQQLVMIAEEEERKRRRTKRKNKNATGSL